MGACFSSTNKNKEAEKIPLPKTETPKDFMISQGDFVNENAGKLTDHYSIGVILGTGGFGEVRKCTHKTTGVVRAVKILKKENYDEESRNLLLMEINILKKLDHPNVVRLYEFYQDKSMFYLIFELCTGGELFDEIVERNFFSEKDAALIMRQLFSVVNYCHSLKMVHRDLKPENLLLDDKSKSLTIKVIDFGTSQLYDSKKKMTQKVGTPYYIAPEVLKGSYNQQCDEWSCGVIMYILLSGRPPFGGSDNEDIIKNVESGSYSLNGKEWATISKEAIDLIKKLLTYDPKRRLTSDQALLHPWIKKFADSQVSQDITNEALLNLKQFRAEEKLTQAAMTFMVSQLLSKEEMAQLKTAFQGLDKNSDGKLSREELYDGYKRILGEAAAEAEVDRIMSFADSDGSGNIDYSEFIMATINKKMLFSNEKLETAFKIFDKDGSGAISAVELKQVLGQNRRYDEKLWDSIISEVDKNNDGEISYEEFKQMMIKCL